MEVGRISQSPKTVLRVECVPHHHEIQRTKFIGRQLSELNWAADGHFTPLGLVLINAFQKSQVGKWR